MGIEVALEPFAVACSMSLELKIVASLGSACLARWCFVLELELDLQLVLLLSLLQLVFLQCHPIQL